MCSRCSGSSTFKIDSTLCRRSTISPGTTIGATSAGWVFEFRMQQVLTKPQTIQLLHMHGHVARVNYIYKTPTTPDWTLHLAASTKATRCCAGTGVIVGSLNSQPASREVHETCQEWSAKGGQVRETNSDQGYRSTGSRLVATAATGYILETSHCGSVSYVRVT